MSRATSSSSHSSREAMLRFAILLVTCLISSGRARGRSTTLVRNGLPPSARLNKMAGHLALASSNQGTPTHQDNSLLFLHPFPDHGSDSPSHEITSSLQPVETGVSSPLRHPANNRPAPLDSLSSVLDVFRRPQWSVLNSVDPAGFSPRSRELQSQQSTGPVDLDSSHDQQAVGRDSTDGHLLQGANLAIVARNRNASNNGTSTSENGGRIAPAAGNTIPDDQGNTYQTVRPDASVEVVLPPLASQASQQERPRRPDNMGGPSHNHQTKQLTPSHAAARPRRRRHRGACSTRRRQVTIQRDGCRPRRVTAVSCAGGCASHFRLRARRARRYIPSVREFGTPACRCCKAAEIEQHTIELQCPGQDETVQRVLIAEPKRCECKPC